MYGIFPYIYHKNQPNVGKYNHTWMVWVRYEIADVFVGMWWSVTVLVRTLYHLVSVTQTLGMKSTHVKLGVNPKMVGLPNNHGFSY